MATKMPPKKIAKPNIKKSLPLTKKFNFRSPAVLASMAIVALVGAYVIYRTFASNSPLLYTYSTSSATSTGVYKINSKTYSVNPDGTGKKLVASSLYNSTKATAKGQSEVHYSPNHAKMAWFSEVTPTSGDTSAAVYYLNIRDVATSSTAKYKLPSGIGFVWHFKWQLDGTKILYQSDSSLSKFDLASKTFSSATAAPLKANGNDFSIESFDILGDNHTLILAGFDTNASNTSIQHADILSYDLNTNRTALVDTINRSNGECFNVIARPLTTNEYGYSCELKFISTSGSVTSEAGVNALYTRKLNAAPSTLLSLAASGSYESRPPYHDTYKGSNFDGLAWSPDGKKLAYQQHDYDQTCVNTSGTDTTSLTIKTVDIASKVVQSVSTLFPTITIPSVCGGMGGGPGILVPSGDSLAWSADGSYIAYAASGISVDPANPAANLSQALIGRVLSSAPYTDLRLEAFTNKAGTAYSYTNAADVNW